MGGLKTTVGLLIVLIGLGAYIYFVESGRTIEDPNAKAKVFTTLAAENIEEIQIRNTNGETTHVQKSGESWQLVAPEKADADAGVVGTVTSNLANLEVQRVVEEKASDLAQYGLNPARIEVAFRLKDAKEMDRILLGDKAPAGGDFYAKRVNEERVILVASFVESILNKSPFDLRDKTILKFERDKADSVEVVRPAGTLRLARNGTDWRIAAPVMARADYAAAEAVLTRLSSTNMLKVVASEPKDLREYGLDRPSLTATVTTGSSKATLLLGNKAPEGGFFAKDASRPVVFTVEEAMTADLGKEIVDLRRKDLFDARSYNANRIELRRADGAVTLEKSEADGKTIWKTSGGQTIDTTRVEDALSKLSNIRADTFAAAPHPSLKMPLLTATITFDENRKETVSFGRAGMDVFAAREDEAGSARVDAMAFDEALKAAEALK